MLKKFFFLCFKTAALTNSTSGGGQSAEELDRLRRTLQEAERDILRKQDEIETLQRKLDFSVTELSGTENVLTESLQDLEKEREKFDRLSTDWNRRVSEMENQLRDTIKRLDRRERDMRDKSEQLKEMQVLQRRHEEMQRNVEVLSRRLKEAEKNRNGAGVAEIEQLEEKLSESEKKICLLMEKVRRLEVNLDADFASDEAKQSEFLNFSEEIREKETVIDNMKQYCNEQGRRLMATLKNEADFLERLLNDKLKSNSINDDSQDIVDLSDDLNAVHQYLNEFLDVDDEKSKEFHFKDVLNRLIEMQEKLVSLSRTQTVSLSLLDDDDPPRNNSKNSMSEFEYETNLKLLHDRIEFLSNELHEARGSAVAVASTSSGYCSDDRTAADCSYKNYGNANNSNFYVPLPSSSEFLWNYPVSLLHDDLSKSLSTFLNEKFAELEEKCKFLSTSDDFTSILIEAMSAEICLISEISNLIEASSSEEHLSYTVVLRDIRNTYVVLKNIESLLPQEESLDEMNANFFHVYCAKINDFLKHQWLFYCQTLPPDVLKLTKFDRSNNSTVRRAAVRYLSRFLLSGSLCDETLTRFGFPTAPLSCFRSAVLKEELNHLLARMQICFESNNGGQKKNIWDKRKCSSTIAASYGEVETLKKRLNDTFRKQMSDAQRLYADTTCCVDDLIDAVRRSVEEHLNRLKSNGTTARTPLTASGTKFVHLEKGLSAELETARLLTIPLNKRGVDEVSKILCVRGTVNGLCAWLDAMLKCFYAKFPSPATSGDSSTNYSLNDVDDEVLSIAASPTPIVENFWHVLKSGLNVHQIADHYEPLTKQLLYQVLTNAVVKLTSACLFCYYETKNEQIVGSNSSSSCDQCSILRRHCDVLTKEKEKLKRRSLCDATNVDVAVHAQQMRELRQEIATMEVKYESERRRIKVEITVFPLTVTVR